VTESVHLFQSRKYKLYCSVGVIKAVLFPVRAVLDTGAGPYLVREDIMPKDWERWRVPNIPLPRITKASSKKILAKGVIVLYVQLGTTVHRVRFYAAPGLTVPCILGCNFIYLHVKAILPKEKKVDLHDGASVAIDNESDSNSNAPPREPATLASTKVRAAQRVVIPPRCEAHVAVKTAAIELCLIQNRIRSGPGQGLNLANGIAEVRPQVPFKVRVINTSHQERILPKGMVLGVAIPHPEQVVSLSSDGVEAVDTEQQSVLGALLSEKQPCEGNAAKTSQGDESWKYQVDLGRLSENERAYVLRILEPHKYMWDGHLGTVMATQHRIQLTPGAQPVHAQPYRAGTRARAAEQEEIQKMLAQDVIEPATCEWASPIMLVPKPDGSLRFCVDYRRLNAITVPDTYPLPRMDECIDSLGEAVVFTTLDCNSGCSNTKTTRVNDSIHWSTRLYSRRLN
jgi:hypothetical protein